MSINLIFLNGIKLMTPYQPGLHILAEFTTSRNSYLKAWGECKDVFENLISTHDLQKVGEVYHSFENGGFTAVVCFTESHLSIHTWPEYGLATFDIYLSNYQRDNSQKVRDFYASVLAFFEGVEINKTEVFR